MQAKILRLPSVLCKTGLSRSALYVLLSQRAFPMQVKLSSRAVGWLENEIENWIGQRAAERNSSEEGLK